jgi:hypothetical protein
VSGGLAVRIYRLLLVVALLWISASVVLADGIDPLVGVKGGGGSTPITITNPNPTVNLTTVQDSSICTIAGDTCAVDPVTGQLPVFQNQLGTTLTSITIFIPTVTIGTSTLVFNCNNAETAASGIFSTCSATGVTGGTDINFSGGPGVPTATLTFVADGDADDSLCPDLGPSGPNCADDFKFLGGEFAVDIEGTLSDGNPDLPKGTNFGIQAVTTPEPSSALMLVFGMLALGLTKVARRS